MQDACRRLLGESCSRNWLERATGFEPATFGMASRRSTAELHPPARVDYTVAQGAGQRYRGSGRVAKSANAADLNSAGPEGPCGFDSHPAHHRRGAVGGLPEPGLPLRAFDGALDPQQTAGAGQTACAHGISPRGGAIQSPPKHPWPRGLKTPPGGPCPPTWVVPPRHLRGRLGWNGPRPSPGWRRLCPMASPRGAPAWLGVGPIRSRRTRGKPAAGSAATGARRPSAPPREVGPHLPS